MEKTGKSSKTKPRRRGFALPISKPCLEKKTEIAVAAIFRDEAAYLQEWIEFHLMVGIDRFILYDNGSRDGSPEILDSYIRGGRVTLFPWAGFSSDPQILAYAHATRNCAPTVRWLALIDIDEFLFSETSVSIRPVLEKLEHYAAVIVPRFEFGPSGHKEEPEGLVIENFTRVANRCDTGRKVKTVLNPNLAAEVAIHQCAVSGKVRRIRDSEPVELRVNHYFSKSDEAFAKKLRRGFLDTLPETRILEKKLSYYQDVVSSAGAEYSMSRFASKLRVRRFRTKIGQYLVGVGAKLL